MWWTSTYPPGNIFKWIRYIQIYTNKSYQYQALRFEYSESKCLFATSVHSMFLVNIFFIQTCLSLFASLFKSWWETIWNSYHSLAHLILGNITWETFSIARVVALCTINQFEKYNFPPKKTQLSAPGNNHFGGGFFGGQQRLYYGVYKWF